MQSFRFIYFKRSYYNTSGIIWTFLNIHQRIQIICDKYNSPSNIVQDQSRNLPDVYKPV